MKKFLTLLAISLFAFSTHAAEEFTVTSPDYVEGEAIDLKHVFNGFGCIGENVSPEIAWSGAPEETKSFAVTVYDPDAPTGSGWWHWVVFNIPASMDELAQGASNSDLLPATAVESRTDYGTTGYGGPCPPEGDDPHKYIITVHALDVEALDLAVDTPAAQVGYYLNAHGIGKATIQATYGR